MRTLVNLVHVGLNAKRGYGTAVQWNGARLQIELWVVEAYMQGTLSNPYLRQWLDRAVRVEVE